MPHDPTSPDHSEREVTRASETPGRALLIAMIVIAVLIVAAAIYITVGYETADDPGAATPAPERLEDSPVRPDLERGVPPDLEERDEDTAPAPLRPEAQP